MNKLPFTALNILRAVITFFIQKGSTAILDELGSHLDATIDKFNLLRWRKAIEEMQNPLSGVKKYVIVERDSTTIYKNETVVVELLTKQGVEFTTVGDVIVAQKP